MYDTTMHAYLLSFSFMHDESIIIYTRIKNILVDLNDIVTDTYQVIDAYITSQSIKHTI